MRSLSLKCKLTILYTVLMMTVVCSVFALLFSMSGKEILTGVQMKLKERVSAAGEEISCKGGGLRFDSDLMSLEHGVYLSIYDADGYLLYGKVPYYFDNSAEFEDGTVRKFVAHRTDFYVMDLFYEVLDYGYVVIRGVSSITDAERSFRFAVRVAVILLPLTVVLTAVVGYFLTRKTLRPVSIVTDTVRKIQNDGDLSRRVSLGSGKDEIYQMADTFDRMLDQIEGSFQREQQFASDVSHELRTPVAAMMLQSEELLKEDLTPPVRDGIALLHRKSVYLSHMISQLLFLTRADQGRQTLAMERLDFSELTALACEEAREELEQHAETGGRRMILQTYIEEHLYIRGDETLLIRFWMNLLENAITYGRAGGRIQVTLQKKGEKIEGSIRDNGIGISEEALPHIWERFYQADSSRTREDSSGLGLSMVKWIVQAHGGEITVRSRLGEGTEFLFWFPLE